MRSLNFDWKPGMPEKDKFIVTGCSAKKQKQNTERKDDLGVGFRFF